MSSICFQCKNNSPPSFPLFMRMCRSRTRDVSRWTDEQTSKTNKDNVKYSEFQTILEFSVERLSRCDVIARQPACLSLTIIARGKSDCKERFRVPRRYFDAFRMRITKFAGWFRAAKCRKGQRCDTGREERGRVG